MDISRSECIYTACYCEENIWKLCKKVCDFSDAALIESCWVIFLSNSERCVPIFKQMKAPRPDHPVFWDYHVILLFAPGGSLAAQLYDFDSTLPFPCPLDVYLKEALRPTFSTDRNLEDWPRTLLRIVSARDYLTNFASDRSHMWNKQLGTYNSPPPDYRCIRTERSANNIQEFIEMTDCQGEKGFVVAVEKFAMLLNEGKSIGISDLIKSLAVETQFPASKLEVNQ